MARNNNAQQRVQEAHPTAFVDDDGDWVYIRTKRLVSGTCPHCHQPWERLETCFMATLGAAGNATAAWEDAAKSLGLL